MNGFTRPYFHAIPFILVSAVSLPASAQTSLDSDSNATANSGSASQAASQSNPTNINAPVNHQGNLTSTSQSNSDAVSGSISGAASNQTQGQQANNDQGQSQGQQANNDQGQTQGQMANNDQTQAQTQGQMATNQQGVNLTFNSTTPKTQKLYTNNPVPLAASSSFSSDYCGGTVSGGASAAPIGISIGGSGPVFDKSCQSLRRAEKFGMAAANAANLGQPELAGRLMSMMIWSICTSDSSGPKSDKSTAQACAVVGLLGNSAASQPEPAPAPEPATRTSAGYPTPEAVSRQPPVATATPPVATATPRLEMAAK